MAISSSEQYDAKRVFYAAVNLHLGLDSYQAVILETDQGDISAVRSGEVPLQLIGKFPMDPRTGD